MIYSKHWSKLKRGLLRFGHTETRNDNTSVQNIQKSPQIAMKKPPFWGGLCLALNVTFPAGS